MLRYIPILTNTLLRSTKLIALPVHLQLEITDACNQRCLMCTRDRLIKRPQVMSLDHFKMAYDQIKPTKINISGLGEPFLNNQIFHIAAHAKKHGSAVNLATNFTLAHRHIDGLSESGIDQIKVSIDAASSQTYLKIRRMDKFAEIVRSIQKLNSLKNMKRISTPEIRFNFALQRQNIAEVLDIINLASHLGVNSIYFQYLEYIDMEDRKSDMVQGLDTHKLRKHLLNAQRLALKKKVHTNLHIWLRDLHLYYNKMEPLELFKPNKRMCYFPWFTTFVEVNGDVKPCPIFAWKRNEGKMGNIFEEEFKKIWNNDSYTQLRKAFNKRHRPHIPCKTCIPQRLTNLFFIFSKMLPTSENR